MIMYNAEMPAMGGKYVQVQNNGGAAVLAILGPKGGVQARVWLSATDARRLRAVLAESYTQEAGRS